MRTVNGFSFTNNGHSGSDRLHLSVDGHSVVTALKVVKTDHSLLCRAYGWQGHTVAQRSFPLGTDVEEVLSLWWCPPSRLNPE